MVQSSQNILNLVKIEDKNVITGKDLKKMFLKAFEDFKETFEIVDRINVFPVPDGDTGLNILETLRAIKCELDTLNENCTISSVIRKIAYGSFNGSVGNSGIILSEYLHGLEIIWQNFDKINLEILKLGFQKATEFAYKCMSNPKEGTILTIQRRISEYTNNIDSSITNPYEALFFSFIESKKALIETHYILHEINKAKTIDAGALAFVLILESIISSVFDNDIFLLTSRTLNSEIKPFLKVDFEELVIEQEWEVIFTIDSIKKSVDLIKNALKKEGECLIITHDHEYADYKVHIHIKKPLNEFLNKLKQIFGEISNIRFTDLKTQSEDFLELIIKD